MPNLNIYPEDMPQELCGLPDLLNHNLAQVSEMVLAARPGQEGVWACELACRQLDDEMVRGPKQLDENTRDRFLQIITAATNYRLQREDDEVVYRKLNFFWQLLFSGMANGDWAVRYMNEARFAVKTLGEIFQRQLDEEDTEEAQEAEPEAEDVA